MKILGISGSPRKESQSGVYKLVQTVLENTGVDYEIVSLRGKAISGCIACQGCVKDNVCKVEDDLTPLREKIVAADAYVLARPTTTPHSMPPPMRCWNAGFSSAIRPATSCGASWPWPWGWAAPAVAFRQTNWKSFSSTTLSRRWPR